MLGHQFAYSSAPIRKVKEVQFGILSPEEIVRARLVSPSSADKFFFLVSRKPRPSQRSSILKLWMKLPINLKWVDSWTREWEQ